jgi:hypothetical protein
MEIHLAVPEFMAEVRSDVRNVVTMMRQFS